MFHSNYIFSCLHVMKSTILQGTLTNKKEKNMNKKKVKRAKNWREIYDITSFTCPICLTQVYLANVLYLE